MSKEQDYSSHEDFGKPMAVERLAMKDRYFAFDDRPTLYPSIAIVFATEPGETHYHVPLLVAPFGYSTYRGS